MPGDKASSRDSAVIDDDLVEALGFEPLSTTRVDKGDTSTVDDVAPDAALGSDLDGDEASARQGVVILGDVIPVEAGDPVASDIAAAILGDSSTDDVQDEATDLDDSDDSDELLELAEDESPEVEDSADDDLADGDLAASDLADVDEELLDLADIDDDDLAEDAGFVLFDADKNDGLDDEDTSSGVLLDEILADDSLDSGDNSADSVDEDSDSAEEAEDLVEAEDLDGSTDSELDDRELDVDAEDEPAEEAVILADDDNEKAGLEDVNADGFGPGIFEKGFDPQETASAFPDVPDVGGSQRVAAKLDNRELHTRPVELDTDDLTSLDQHKLLVDTGGDSNEVLLDTEVAPAAVGVAPARSGYRPKRIRAKKTRRVIRHIDPWSVLTFSVLFHLALYAAFLLASVLVWKTLEASGMVENIEDFIIALGDYETYQINADVLFRAGVIIAGILTVASTILSVLLSVVFNLISDLVGGIRVTVLEEETVRLPSKKSAPKSR